LPKELKDYAQIGSEAVFLGVNERIELWDKKIYQNYGAIREAQIRETAIQHYNRIKQLNQKKDE
jgi:DNA-binding transcriptional regulator/RsmH inhibitor MraZ